jgi:23S rRNA (cytosine1962-C5)-methyltransferase
MTIANLDHAFVSALAELPEPPRQRIALHVVPEAERAIRNGHPWLFDRAISKQNHDGPAGSLAIIFDRKDRFLAVGLYDPHSTIRVRILQQGKSASINDEFFRKRISAAARLRAPIMEMPPELLTNAFRLINGENDGFPGLVVDRYAKTVVVKLYSSIWAPYLNAILQTLAVALPTERMVLRLSRTLQAVPSLSGLSDGMLLSGEKPDGVLYFKENGLQFEVDPFEGQKTGFFLDQRDNRVRVEHLSAGKNILNLFSYTGGFSVYAARGGAQSVLDIDQSAPALEAAQRNMKNNANIPAVAAVDHRTQTGDVFPVLYRMVEEGQKFDMIIVDPPMFAQNQAQEAKGMNAYKTLTRMSIALLKHGGILVQASCSSRVPADLFFDSVHKAALNAGRPLREIERSEHALDHPVTFREGSYLKCLFARVP